MGGQTIGLTERESETQTQRKTGRNEQQIERELKREEKKHAWEGEEESLVKMNKKKSFFFF